MVVEYDVKKRAKIIEDTLDKLVPEKVMWRVSAKTEDDKFFILVRLILSTVIRYF